MLCRIAVLGAVARPAIQWRNQSIELPGAERLMGLVVNVMREFTRAAATPAIRRAHTGESTYAVFPLRFLTVRWL